ncbi:MAG: hypothetical protein LQ343_002737 [Gyalolechia ehrenbergii]|nr:MAG: hypothetical protein LQ343_002737 [Gyalolechia ehrenbergii]
MAWRIWSTVQQERSSDIFYDWYYIGLQSQLEIWLGMIAASLPTLAPIASKLIAPAFSKLIASYRKHGAPLGNRTNESRKTGGGCGDVPLPKLDTNHFDGESIVGFGNVQHWGTAESIRREDDSFTETHSDEQRDGHDAIIVRHGYSVLAEPRQEV